MHTNTNTKWTVYKELELIPDWVPEPKLTYPKSAPSWVSKLWQMLTDRMTPNYEPKISQIRDSDGDIWWKVYDPIAEHTIYMASEEEVLVWLDQYYGI